MSELYDLALEFYQTLKTAQNKLGSGLALANTEVFYLLANAGWHIQAGDLKELINWYEIMGLPPAVITSGENTELNTALKNAGFTAETSFAFRVPEANPNSSIQVEQVSWSQMRYAGELLAKHYEQPENAVAISKSLTKAVQSNAGIKAYLGYKDEAESVMITFETDTYIISMLSVDETGAMEHHLVQMAQLGLEPLLLEALPAGVSVSGKMGLRRWSIR